MGKVIAAALIVTPLAIAPSVLFYFDLSPKVVALQASCAALLLWAAWNPERLLHNRRFTILAASLVCWVLMAAAAAPDAALAFFGSSWRRLGALNCAAIVLLGILFTAWLAGDGARITRALRAVAAAGVLASLYGCSQYFGFDPLLSSADYRAGEGPFAIVRPPGTFGHADYFAAWLGMVLFCDIALARAERSRAMRYAAWTAAGLAAFTTVLTGTRSALIGIFAGGVYWVWQERPAITRSRMLAAGAAIAVFCGFVASPWGMLIRSRAKWSADDVRGGARLLLWRDSLALIAQHPLAGVGPENFVREFPKSQSLDLARAYPDFYHESPHNALLDVMAGAGIPGAVLWIGLAVVAWRASRANNGPPIHALRAGLVGTVICHQFTVLIPATAVFFFVLLGFLAGSAARNDRAPIRAAPLWVRIPPVALAAALLLCASRIVVSDLQAAKARTRLDAADLPGAAAAYESSVRLRLPGPGPDLYFCRRFAGLAANATNSVLRDAALGEAFQAGERAAASADDRQNALYALAGVFAASGDPKGVETSLRAAITASPSWFKPRWALAQLLEMSGRHREAVEQAGAAFDRDGGKDEEVRATWLRISGHPSQ